MADEEKQKKPRGNPNFQKRNTTTQNTEPKMADDKKEESKPTTTTDTKAEAKVEPKKDDAPAETSASTDLPADLFSDKIPGEEVLPLDGQVKEMSYAALPTDGGTPVAAGATTFEEAKPGDPSATAPTTAPVAPPPTPEEMKSQAEQTADLMLKGYDKIHVLGRYLGKVADNDLAQMHAKGKINLDQQLPIGKKRVRIGDFFDEYNQSIDENIVVSEEFKTNIKPPLVRVCLKHGWLLNDEMYILTLLADDVVTKTSMLIGLKKSANLILDACQQMMKATNERNAESKAKVKEAPPADQHPPMPEEAADWHEPEGGGPEA